MTIEPGIERTETFTVEDRLVTDVGGTIGTRVLSTPGMIGMMERCSSVLSFENLDDGKATVGFEVSVKHVLRTAGGLLGLLERFPSSHLQVVCDPYNYVSRNLLPAHERVTRDLLDRFEHRFVLAHGKDVGPDGAEASTPELGTGVFVQEPYLDFLRTRRPDLPLILEHLVGHE